ncbi:MAG: hypothetical protein HQL66_01335 [Magnetococcales bacterium]|nr:hypothetical protein [Magnetococcales bacterium]
MINRIILLILSVLGGVALPYSVTLALGSYEEYLASQDNLRAAVERKVSLEGLRNQAKTYKAFAQEVDTFTGEVKSREITEGDWVLFKVDNVTRALEANDFRLVIANVMHGGGYYFSPSHIEMISGSSENFMTTLRAQKIGGSGANKPGPGSHIIMTIKGEYLVAKRRG